MATTGFNKAVANLKFLQQGINSFNHLAGYLQGFLGQTAGVIRKTGSATVLSGGTSIVVTDAGIATTDIVIATQKTAGANATKIVSYTISAATSFTLNVDTDPGAGGVLISYLVIRPVSHQ